VLLRFLPLLKEKAPPCTIRFSTPPTSLLMLDFFFPFALFLQTSLQFARFLRSSFVSPPMPPGSFVSQCLYNPSNHAPVVGFVRDRVLPLFLDLLSRPCSQILFSGGPFFPPPPPSRPCSISVQKPLVVFRLFLGNFFPVFCVSLCSGCHKILDPFFPGRRPQLFTPQTPPLFSLVLLTQGFFCFFSPVGPPL